MIKQSSLRRAFILGEWVRTRFFTYSPSDLRTQEERWVNSSLENRYRLIIELITTALIIFSSKSIDQERVVEEKRSDIPVLTDGTALNPEFANASVENHVREYFADTPVLVTIAFCESHFRHLGKDGEVLRGEKVSTDVGVMQINEYFHGKTAQTLGHNLHTLSGNLEYAKWLYEREGTQPWSASSGCWSTEIAQR